VEDELKYYLLWHGQQSDEGPPPLEHGYTKIAKSEVWHVSDTDTPKVH
jgi:hypothetical protein